MQRLYLTTGTEETPAATLEQTVFTTTPGLSPALDRTGWTITVSDETWGAGSNALDGNDATFWSTNGAFPAWAVIDMQTAKTFDAVKVLPRQGGLLDYPGEVEIYVSTDGLTWGSAVYTVSGLACDATAKVFGPFPGGAVTKRYVKYNILSQAAGGRIYQGGAEINVGTYADIPVTAAIDELGWGRFVPKSGVLPYDAEAYAFIAPNWGTWSFCDGVVGVAYAHLWDLVGCDTPTSYSLVTGALPDGLTLADIAGNQGRIYGTPTVAGEFTFTLRATNSYGTADAEFTITIDAAPPSGGDAIFIG